MSNASQAAMALRALHPTDRAWMLSQLSSEEKASIHDFISHADTSALPAQSFELAVAREERNALTEPAIVTRLNALDPFQIACILEREPDWVVALVIDAHRWPWHNLVLNQLGLERESRITRIDYSPLPHRIIESMLESLYARAAAIPVRLLPTPTVTKTVHTHWANLQRKLNGVIAWAR